MNFISINPGGEKTNCTVGVYNQTHSGKQTRRNEEEMASRRRKQQNKKQIYFKETSDEQKQN